MKPNSLKDSLAALRFFTSMNVENSKQSFSRRNMLLTGLGLALGMTTANASAEDTEDPLQLEFLDYNPDDESYSLQQIAEARRQAVMDTSLVTISNRRSNRGYMWPVQGVILSPYGPRGGRLHAGVDIDGPVGAKVAASRGGLILTAGRKYSGYGNMVDIRHEDGVVTRYGHGSKILVRVGERVEQGQPVMLLGCTGRCSGPHVHFEVRVNGRPTNPMAFLR